LLRWLPSLRGGVGSALHGVARISYGEVLFAPSVAAVFHGAGNDFLMHAIPIGILTISDAAGALAGTRWGMRRYGCGEGFKTVEGSIAFLATAFLCGFLPLFLSGRTDLGHAVWIGLILATLAMMAEGISDRGFDNLVVPLGCYFVLGRLLPLDTAALLGRAIALAVLLSMVYLGSRWSTLNGASLLAAALLGYGCAVIADWRFALPPVAVFVCHLFITRRFELTKAFDHRLDTVLSHALACLPWVILAGLEIIPKSLGLAGVSFAMAAQLAMLDDAALWWLGQHQTRPLASALKGWLVAGLPGLIWLLPEFTKLWFPAAASFCITMLALIALHRLRLSYRGSITGLWLIKGLLALSAALPALLLLS
jgi:phytol kinase